MIFSTTVYMTRPVKLGSLPHDIWYIPVMRAMNIFLEITPRRIQ